MDKEILPNWWLMGMGKIATHHFDLKRLKEALALTYAMYFGIKIESQKDILPTYLHNLMTLLFLFTCQNKNNNYNDLIQYHVLKFIYYADLQSSLFISI